MIRMLGRKKVARRIFWALAIIIIPSFVFWGVGDVRRGARRHLAARVNGADITREAFHRHLGELLQQRRRYGDDDLREGTPEMDALREQALEDLVRQELLVQAARRKRIRVGDDQLFEHIRQDPAFRDEDGNFDQRMFERAVEMVPGEQWLEYEDEIRTSLKLRKLHDRVVEEIDERITDEEIAAYRAEHGFDEQIGDDLLRQFVAYQKKADVYEDWYRQLRERARVEVFLE